MTLDEAVKKALQVRMDDEENRHRMTLEGFADVDAGRTVAHDAVQARIGALLHEASARRWPRS